MKTDIEIAHEQQLEPIQDIAKKIDISEDELELYGKYKAKVTTDIDDSQPQGKLILVTAINPTKAGEGKSTTTIGLCDALCAQGYNAAVALREPSMGPVFGLKGGATGGGYAQVVPMEDINLHFTGDMHAITAANNLICACIDNSIYQGNVCNIDPEKVVFKRACDMNDRTLREITVGQGKKTNGIERKGGFNISVASEVMACLCLASDLQDLKLRLGRMLVAYTYDGQPVYVHDLHIEGACAALLKDAIKPNLVQTLEHNPAFIHGGPFANIAHGCNSLIATKLALQKADYVVTEAGFGADLGAEKFLNIACRYGKLKPAATVIVATIRALKLHGGLDAKDLNCPNVDALEQGCENLQKHIETLKAFGLPYVVAINQFDSDAPEEIDALLHWAQANNHPISLSQVWKKGSSGAYELAQRVVELTKQANTYKPLYELDTSLEDKMRTIAQVVYGAKDIELSDQAHQQLKQYKQLGWDKLCVCMAKTPNSLTDDPKIMQPEKDFVIHVRELRPSLGAGFIVALTGNVLTMPGLPQHPAAEDIDVDAQGNIVGLF